ncbi:MAG: glycosyltransferase family 2 protein [Clostridia bacterium]|nr:glycosyltransferase family 2 protein [Clostridia bacterium]
MKIGIGAIFRDEFDYIIEWLSYHIVAGFNDYLIADNGSTDGTRELLEALQEVGFISLLYQPVVENFAQIRAYNKIVEKTIELWDAILFIDADEFLVHDSFVDGAEMSYLINLLSDQTIGLIGINWRCFGSSGLEDQDERLVIERFRWCADDSNIVPYSKVFKSILNNNNIKSLSNYSFHQKADVHISFVTDDAKKVSVLGDNISQFLWPIDGIFCPVSDSPIVSVLESAPLRINHYLIKSKSEYTTKKRVRGDAQSGINTDRGEQYFFDHDFDDKVFNFPHKKIASVKKKIVDVLYAVNHSTFTARLIGNIDVSNCDEVVGWLGHQSGHVDLLFVSVFVNGVHKGLSPCKFYRPDVKERGFSVDGRCGFRFTHPQPLASGDVVEIYVYANRFRFENFRSVI